MIPNHREVTVVKSDVPLDTLEMAVSMKNMGLLMVLLRDNLYSNKNLAPIREYSTNALDAHIEAGIKTRPIEVTLPSQLESTFKIRDFGFGLDYNQLRETYFIYLESSKRGSNDTNGVLGLGSKSAFAYGDIFIVTTINNGRKLIVTCPSSGKPTIDFDGPTDEEQGTEISIPILMKDIPVFITESLNFYKYWDVRPIIKNCDPFTIDSYFNSLDSKPIFSIDGSWEIRPAGGYNGGESRAVMSSVPYPINWQIVEETLPESVKSQVEGIFEFLRHNTVTLRFENGSLEFTPNREALQYTEFTLNSIGEKLISIFNTILNLITSKIAGAENIWEAMVIYNQVFNSNLLEKGDQFGGNLHRIESLLSGKLVWNGKVITAGDFTDFQKWDKIDGFNPNGGGRGYSRIDYVLQTFTKSVSHGSVELHRCHRRRNNTIVAASKSVIVIQDTEKSYKAAAARYVFNVLEKDATKIYLLNLSNPDVKEKFFKNYPNLELCPAYLTSNIGDAIKAYSNTLKGPRSAGTATVDADRNPQYATYIEIKDRRESNYVGGITWNNEDTNIRGVEDGGIYVIVNKEREVSFNGKDFTNPSYLFQAVYDLCQISARKIDKVYGIRESTSKTQWFKESIGDGTWTSLAEIVKEDAGWIDKDKLKKLFNFESYLSLGGRKIGAIIAKKLLPLINNKDTESYSYLEMVADIPDSYNFKFIAVNLNLWDICKDSPDVVFSKAEKCVENRYPMIYSMGEWSYISNSDPANKGYHPSNDLVQTIADYINLVDNYLKLKDEEVKKEVDMEVAV